MPGGAIVVNVIENQCGSEWWMAKFEMSDGGLVTVAVEVILRLHWVLHTRLGMGGPFRVGARG